MLQRHSSSSGRNWPSAPRGGGLAQRGSSGLSPWGDSGAFSLLRQLDEDMSRLFDEFLGGSAGASEGGATGWMPPVEVSERDGRVHVCTDLPGLSKDDVKVDIADGQLVIQGERRRESGPDEGDPSRQRGGYYRSERSYGSFFRSISLPEGVNVDSAQASFRDGVLDVSFDAPQAAQSRSRRLAITEGSAGAASSAASSTTTPSSSSPSASSSSTASGAPG